MMTDKNSGFRPVNRHLWLTPVKTVEEEAKTTILVPDDYKVKKSPYETFEVVAIADDCTVNVKPQNVVVADNTMTNKICLNNKEYYLILENYIFGVFEKA